MPRSCSCSIQSIVARAVVDLTDLVVDTGVEEDALGRRGLAGIDVRHDADVADPVRSVVMSVAMVVCQLVLVVSARASPGRVRTGARPVGAGLPAVVGERLVGLGHLVRVLAPLDRGTEAVARRRAARSSVARTWSSRDGPRE